MRHAKSVAIGLIVGLSLIPATMSAQYRNLDAAMAGISRGFERGETQPILEGIASGEKVNLEFPGLVTESGFLGRDQASYLLDELFDKVHPSDFQQASARKVSAQAQYHITAKWTVKVDDKSSVRDLYITLKERDDHWSIVSIQSK